ncbi:hypothetical protein [Aurantiacibacter aquimixticola]|uniref:DUF3325 domain-containing protein n=1 Tax=Aurantiacibacter aquimixticola TaxID=1958945 RepID=A0A419RUU5_9SPHN|nr:hypothetical protein [Aurantiacibacter aquimixticola]RJY09552.1 hypothetical protein D6201_09445 [Aurantiacibacter aquimixticola]
MALAIAFLLGIGNFAWHRAVMNSGHRMVSDMPYEARKTVSMFSMVLEFVLLCGAMYAAANGAIVWLLAYLGYSILNGSAAWAMVSGRL